MNTEKTEDNQELSASETPFTLSMELPEATEVSQSYHDDEFITNLEDSEQNQDVSETSNNPSDHVTVESNSESSILLDEEREKARGIKDDKGKEFDPSIHVFPPEKTPSGIWKKLPKSKRKNDDGKEVLPTVTNATIKRSAEKAANLYDTAHILAFGEDGKADAKQLGKLSESFERFFQEKGAIDLPPHLDLIVTCISHSTEVCKRPTVTERIKGKLAIWTVKRQFKKLLKSEQITEAQFAEAKGHLAQGMEHFTKWQDSLRGKNNA